MPTERLPRVKAHKPVTVVNSATQRVTANKVNSGSLLGFDSPHPHENEQQ